MNAWIREGLVTETTATGPGGNPFKVLTLTRSGVAEARKLAAERGMDPSQEIRFARTRPAQAAHDTAVYRACMKEKQRLLDRGAAVRRIRLDTELKSAVARGSEAARLKDGKRAADAERHRTAGELGLPVDDEGHVLYPDAQIEYTDADGRTGRINVEVASGNYRDWWKSIAEAKFPTGRSCSPSSREESNDGTHETYPAQLRRRRMGPEPGTGLSRSQDRACSRSTGRVEH